MPKLHIYFPCLDDEEMADHIVENGNLHFAEVQADHGGTYVCTAKVLNKETNQVATATQKLLLTVHGKGFGLSIYYLQLFHFMLLFNLMFLCL